MKTAFATGPGFFAARTNKADPSVPPGVMRFLVARVEAYEGPIAPEKDSGLGETSFTILAALCEGRPVVARALLELAEHINQNRELIEAEAKK